VAEIVARSGGCAVRQALTAQPTINSSRIEHRTVVVAGQLNIAR